MNRPDILNKILLRKDEEIALRSSSISLQDVEVMALDAIHSNPVRGFVAAMQRRVADGEAAVIAEIKRASPSKGLLRENFVPSEIAQSYEYGGAACLSV